MNSTDISHGMAIEQPFYSVWCVKTGQGNFNVLRQENLIF